MKSTMDGPRMEQGQSALDRVIGRVRASGGADLAEASASVAFRTVQAAQHGGRSTGYTNSVLSLRCGSAVGSCAVEPGELDDDTVCGLAGRPIRELLDHQHRAVRVAALDAYLAATRPYHECESARRVPLPRGDSLTKSLARSRAVTSLLSLPAGSTVAVVGVVNSLLVALRERELEYVPCDRKGGRTEWDETVLTDHHQALRGCDAVLTTGMVLGNGSFDGIAEYCREHRVPLAAFAQTGAAVLRELLGGELQALSAEPYPFFWLTGEPGEIYLYGTASRT